MCSELYSGLYSFEYLSSLPLPLPLFPSFNYTWQMPTHYVQNRQQVLSEAEIIKNGRKSETKRRKE
jgi:hypothetical protein